MSTRAIKYASYVREAIEEKRNKNEQLRKKILSNIFDALDKLYKMVNFDEAFLFGSVTNPYSFYETSDIDIGFLNLKDEDFFLSISFLSEVIGRDVDILQLESTRRLKERILKDGIRWIRKN